MTNLSKDKEAVYPFFLGWTVEKPDLIIQFGPDDFVHYQFDSLEERDFVASYLVPNLTLRTFQHEMETKVIPEIVKVVRERLVLADEARRRVV